MSQTIILTPNDEGSFEAQYPEQYQALVAMSGAAVAKVESTDQDGTEKFKAAVKLVVNAAYDFVDLFAQFPDAVDQFVKAVLIPALVDRAFGIAKATGLLGAQPEVKQLPA